VEIDGILVAPGRGSTVSTMRQSQRTLYRKHLIVDAALRHFSVEGARVLDLACNMGYWSYQYMLRGARVVYGIEGRQQFVDQATLFWDYCDQLLSTAKISCGSVLDDSTMELIGTTAPYDVCLCCGLLYHLEDYRTFLSRVVAAAQPDVMVIDTRVTEGSELAHDEPTGIYFNSLDTAPKRAVTPNLSKLLKHLKSLGYATYRLQPKFFMPESTKAVDDYIRGNRVTIVAQKG
jgi:2-polyprenyl-3-methyl-5-hydroxy-6-metoxy-1,4-benzoquinol methylase